jgi:NADPH-dependent curcumin reductase CurA
MPQSAKRVVLVSRPVGEPRPSDFRIEEYALPTPGKGQVLLRTIWLSLDPYMRGRMSDGPSYAAPVPIGGVMEGGTVSEVIASNDPAFANGDIVLSRAGWQTHALSDGKGLTKIDPKIAPVSTAVGVLGMPGMTAYTGLLDIGKPTGGRDRRRCRSLRRGRLGGWTDREDQRRAGCGHRRRQGQMRLRQKRVRLR